MKEENNIEELFRSSFGEFEATPPPAVKQAVDRAIAAAPWYRRGLWVLLLLLLIGAGTLAFFGLRGDGSSIGHTASSTVSGSGESENGASGSVAANGRQSSDDAQNDRSGTAPTNAGSATEMRTSSSAGSEGNRNGGGNRNNTPFAAGNPRGQARSSASGRPNGETVDPAGRQTGDPVSRGEKSDSGSSGQSGSDAGNDTDPKDPTDPVGSSKEDPRDETAKSDSVVKKWTPDSTVKESLPRTNKKLTDDSKKWYASIYAGPQLSFNAPTPAGYTFDEKASFRVSGEINRTLVGGYGVATGLGHNSWSESFGFEMISGVDSTYLYTDSVPVYGDPQFPDSITGYNFVDVYDIDTTTVSSSEQRTVRTLFIPFYVSRQFAFDDNWGMLVNAGAVFNFYKVTGDSATTSDFGMSLSARIHATYKWKNWMFSAGLGGGWDLGIPSSYAGYDRKRYWITPQAGVHFSF